MQHRAIGMGWGRCSGMPHWTSSHLQDGFLSVHDNKEEFHYSTIGTIYSVTSTFRWCEEQRSRQPLLPSIHPIFSRSNLVPMNDLFYCTSTYKEIIYLLNKKHIQLLFFVLMNATVYVWRWERQTWRESGFLEKYEFCSGYCTLSRKSKYDNTVHKSSSLLQKQKKN